MNRIDGTDLEVFPLCFGGNAFGWTADEPVDAIFRPDDPGHTYLPVVDRAIRWLARRTA